MKPLTIFTACLILNLTATCWAQSDAPKRETIPAQPRDDDKQIPVGLDVYLGRTIAQTMHYSGAEWLIRDRREREERCSMMLANLGVKPGMTICDMGCGNGFHTLQLAQITGDTGTVFGVDIQPEMLELMRERMEEKGIENVIPFSVLSTTLGCHPTHLTSS